MDILLIPNLSKKNGYECTCEVIRRMTGYGCSCWMVEESMHEFAGQPVKSFPPQGQKIDMIFFHRRGRDAHPQRTPCR